MLFEDLVISTHLTFCLDGDDGDDVDDDLLTSLCFDVRESV